MQPWQDSDQASIYHWYTVPSDRPCLPVASFIGISDWNDPNGPRGMMDKGFPPGGGVQGEVWGDRRYDRRELPPPGELFTGHYCGTADQWAGELRTTRPSDLGKYGCCWQVDRVGGPCGCGALQGTAYGGRRDRGTVCGCANLSGSGTGYSFPAGTLCGCGALQGTAYGGRRDTGTVCGCGALSGSGTGYSFPAGTLCGCGSLSGSATFTVVATGTLCGCGSLSGSALGPYSGTLCGCGALSGTATFAAFPSGSLCGCISLRGAADLTPVVTFTCGDLTPLGTNQSTAAPITTDNVYVRNPAANNAGIILPGACNRIVTRYEGGGMSLFQFIIYPPVGGTIDGNPINTGITISPGLMTWRLFVTTDSLNYRSFTSN